MTMLAHRFALATTIRPTSGIGAISIAMSNPMDNTSTTIRRFASSMTSGPNRNTPVKATPEKALKSVLEAELKYEKEEAESDPVEVPSEVVEHFKAIGLNISKDAPGDALVILSGEKNGTKLALSFDVRQVYLNELDDTNLEDEEMEEQKEEQSPKEEDEFDEDEDEDAGLEPVAAKVLLTRGSSSLSFEISLSSDGVDIHSMHTGALPLGTELYTSNAFTGPNYADLSTDLQEVVSEYLESFGINSELADVLRTYMDVKERKEYITWLGNVRDFFK